MPAWQQQETQTVPTLRPTLRRPSTVPAWPEQPQYLEMARMPFRLSQPDNQRAMADSCIGSRRLSPDRRPNPTPCQTSRHSRTRTDHSSPHNKAQRANPPASGTVGMQFKSCHPSATPAQRLAASRSNSVQPQTLCTLANPAVPPSVAPVPRPGKRAGCVPH